MSVAVTGTACDLREITGLGGKTTPPPSPKASPAKAAQPIRPTFASPITYRAANVKMFEITYLNALVRFPRRDADFQLGFRVDQPENGEHPLLTSNLAMWRADGIRPERFTVDGADAYRAERPPKAREGASRFYIAVRESVAVTASVWASPGKSLTDAQRQTADRLFNSVKFDKTGLSGFAKAAQPVPVVPFSYQRPPGLSGGTQASDGLAYFTDLRLSSGQIVKVQLSSYPKPDAAHRAYRAQRRELDAIAGVHTKDVKAQSSTRGTLGRQVDEGFGHLVRQKGIRGHVIEEFTFRKGRLLASVNASGRGRALAQDTLDCVTSIITSIRFTRDHL